MYRSSILNRIVSVDSFSISVCNTKGEICSHSDHLSNANTFNTPKIIVALLQVVLQKSKILSNIANNRPSHLFQFTLRYRSDVQLRTKSLLIRYYFGWLVLQNGRRRVLVELLHLRFSAAALHADCLAAAVLTAAAWKSCLR